MAIRTRRITVLAASAALAALAALASRPLVAQAPAASQPPPPTRPCLQDPRYRQFDFWVGAWDVRTPAGGRAGSSRVEVVAEGCGVHEMWTAANGNTGRSLNAFNTVAGMWQQYWIGPTGMVTEYRTSTRTPEGGIAFTADVQPPGGPAHRARMTFTPLDPDRVRQHGERSADGGATWTTTFDLVYHRVQP